MNDYNFVTDITPNDIWPSTHFKTGEEINVTLREIIDSIGDNIKNNHPIRIYSKQNHSVVGSVINGKELIPENVLKYKYISAEVQENTRLKNTPTILVITVE